MKKVLPKNGDRRTVGQYLLFPKIIDGVRRWLEFAVWEEEFVESKPYGIWFAKRWI